MVRPIASTALCLLIASVALSACGGGGGGAELTKAEFIARADAICRKADQEQEKHLLAYSPKHQKQLKTQAGINAMIRAVGVPPLEAEANEIEALVPPKQDAKEVEAIVEGIRQATAEGMKDPAKFEEGPTGAFARVNKLAAQFGFKACSEAS